MLKTKPPLVPTGSSLLRWLRQTLLFAQITTVALVATAASVSAQTAGKKPNILVIMGDDIGWYNPSIYHRGDMGYWRPNIDRIGKEGAMFTCWYGQQSCTEGGGITGQSPIRTGLTKVGLPGADVGLHAEDPTIAELLKTLGYATGQFGKNHLGDKDEFLPSKHGFDEFFGNLYHLNAEEEPENPDYPKNPEFRKKFGPRGVMKATADGKIEDTGPLTRKRMETVDEEFLAAALDFIDRQHKAGKPFFCWFNSTRMHIFTHLKKESEGKKLSSGFRMLLQHRHHTGIPLDVGPTSGRRGASESPDRDGCRIARQPRLLNTVTRVTSGRLIEPRSSPA